MEGQSSIVIVHLDIPVVFFADLADAFQSEAVRTLIRFGSGWICRIIFKRVYAAGIDHCDQNKRCIFPLAAIDFDISVGNFPGSFHGIIQQIAKKRSKVTVRQKMQYTTADVSGKTDSLFSTLPPVPCHNGVQKFVVADAGGLFKIRREKQFVNIGVDFVRGILLVQRCNGLQMLLNIMNENCLVFALRKQHLIIFRKICFLLQ